MKSIDLHNHNANLYSLRQQGDLFSITMDLVTVTWDLVTVTWVWHGAVLTVKYLVTFDCLLWSEAVSTSWAIIQCEIYILSPTDRPDWKYSKHKSQEETTRASCKKIRSNHQILHKPDDTSGKAITDTAHARACQERKKVNFSQYK